MDYAKVRRYRWAIVVPILAVLALASCFFLPDEEKLLEPPLVMPPAMIFDEIEVTRGDVVNTLEVTAYFQTFKEQNLYFKYRGGPLRAYYHLLGDEVEKGTVLAELEMGNLPIQILQQELMVRKAEINHEKLELMGSDRFQVALAAIDIQLAQLKLKELRITASNATVVAPFDGIIAYRSPLMEGDYVNAYQPLMRIADQTELSLVYSGGSASVFRPGMQIDARIGEDVYRAQVIQTAANLPAGADPELKKFVVFGFRGSIPKAKRGDRARVVATLSKRENVLILPTKVVHTYVDTPFVNVLKDGIKKEQPIEIGIRTDTEVEITKGLNEGDKVLW